MRKRTAVRGNPDKLHFLRHSFGKFLHFLIPPVADFHTLEPFLETFLGIAFVQTFQPGKEYCLLPYFHFFVETTLFREIAYMLDIIGCGCYVVVCGWITKYGLVWTEW